MLIAAMQKYHYLISILHHNNALNGGAATANSAGREAAA